MEGRSNVDAETRQDIDDLEGTQESNADVVPPSPEIYPSLRDRFPFQLDHLCCLLCRRLDIQACLVDLDILIGKTHCVLYDYFHLNGSGSRRSVSRLAYRCRYHLEKGSSCNNLGLPRLNGASGYACGLA